MKIRARLEQVQISEVTYHALRRNEAITFMPRRQKGHGDFPYEQLLALKTFALLRHHGLSSRAAAETVESFYPVMKKFAEEGDLSSEADYKIRVRLVAVKGKITFEHLDRQQTVGSIEVGRLELDLRGISALLALPANLLNSN